MKFRAADNEICILQSLGERVVSADAVATCSATFFIWPASALSRHIPVIGVSQHPVWSGLYCKNTVARPQKSGIVVVATYEGVDYSNEGTSVASDMNVEVACTMKEEDIRTHPKFTDWAGTPQNPVGGIFEDKKFVDWNEETDIGKEFRGVKSYLVPGYTATISYTAFSRPSLGDIGHIGNVARLPSVGTRKWMNTGLAYQTLADGKYKVTENYLLSGPKGWNEKIYD